MGLAEETELAAVPQEDLKRAHRGYEAYCATVGFSARPFEVLPVRLQLGWVAAMRTARLPPAATAIASGTAAGDLRCG